MDRQGRSRKTPLSRGLHAARRCHTLLSTQQHWRSAVAGPPAHRSVTNTGPFLLTSIHPLCTKLAPPFPKLDLTQLHEFLHPLSLLFHKTRPHLPNHAQRLLVAFLLGPRTALPLFRHLMEVAPSSTPATAPTMPSSPSSATEATTLLLRWGVARQRLSVPRARLVGSGLECESVHGLQLQLQERVTCKQALEVGIVLEVGEVYFRDSLVRSRPITFRQRLGWSPCPVVFRVRNLMDLVAVQRATSEPSQSEMR